EQQEVNVWMVNTGWTGGSFGEGSRMKLKYTRSMISAALVGLLDEVAFQTHGVFEFQIPLSCPDVPTGLLNPRDSWKKPDDYDEKDKKVALKFIDNFEKYADFATEDIQAGAPKVKR